jgi:ribosome-associated toxin RatA of RatAB toxin-antitoxin module
MSTVNVRASVPHRGPAEAFELIADFGRYAEICPEVRSVSVAAIDEHLLRSTWEVEFRDGALTWTEEDRLDPGAGTISFDQVDGDFEAFGGAWEVRAVGSGSEVSFRADFDLGITSLRSIIDPIAERSLRENIEMILVRVLGDGTAIESGPPGATS